MTNKELKELSNLGQKTAEAGKKLADACKSQTKEELEFALDKALEVAKGKEEQIKYLVNKIDLLNDLHAKEIKELKAQLAGLRFSSNVEMDFYKNETALLKLRNQKLANKLDKLEDRNIIPHVPIEDRAIHPNYSEPDHTSARITISAIIGIAAGFILALILL